MRRVSVAVVCSLTLVLSSVAVQPALAGHNGHFGGHEMDGNTTVDDGGIDWDSPPPGVTEFTDASGGNDDVFTGGSKQLAPHQWKCTQSGSAPGKSDLTSGAIYFNTSEGKEYVFFNFTRRTANGDANIDYEFNQSSEPNPSCPDLPRRTAGDILIAFDTDTGKNKKALFVRAFTWTGNSSSGTFEELFVGEGEDTQGDLWDAATGDGDLFGEGGINLTDALPGVFECGKFATAFLKSRSSTSISASLQDYIKARPFELGQCPESELHKAVRNETTDGQFDDSATAAPGDIIQYQLTYHNHGDGSATEVIVTDTVPERSTFLDCTGGCENTDPTPGGDITWDLGTQLGGAAVVLTFRVQLDATFPEGTTDITNVAVVDTDEEPEKESNETTVTVSADALFTVQKEASETTVAFGDTITYTITVTNEGNAAGTIDVIDDYDQDRVTVSNISNGGVDDTDTITWTVTLDPGESKELTYDATFDKPLSGGEPQGDCPEGQISVVNTVTVGDDSDSVEVCLVADPDLVLEKSADATLIAPGDSVTYTLAYSNEGTGPAFDVVITEEVPEGTAFESCSDDCAQEDGTVTWAIGEVAAGDSGSVTLTVLVLDNVGCVVCNVATIAADNQDATPSNEVCITAIPGADPSGANADGSAFGAHLAVSLLGLDEVLIPVSSSQSGVGSSGESDSLFGVDVPGALSAEILSASSTSTVSETPAQSRQLSVAEAVGVSVLGGVVTADLVRGVAEATTTGDSTSVSSLGSTLVNVRVNGVLVEDVAPNTTIPLLGDLFGPGSYVALYEVTSSTSAPASDQLEGGTYAADIEVNMIRVHITDLLGATTAQVVVSNAIAHSDFPQTLLCEEPASQTVSGHAYVASAATDPDLLSAMVGFVSIPATGGHAHQNLEEAAVPDDGSFVTAGAAFSDSAGTNGETSSDASSVAQVADVCLLPMNGECTVGAALVRARSNSTASEAGASSDDGDSVLLGVTLGGEAINLSADPNQVIDIPGIGFVIFNEQFCDNGAALEDGCGDGAGHAGLTVRAIRLVLTVPLGVEVIVAEAHSDATFIAPGPVESSGGSETTGGGNGGGNGGGQGNRKK